MLRIDGVFLLLLAQSLKIMVCLISCDTARSAQSASPQSVINDSQLCLTESVQWFRRYFTNKVESTQEKKSSCPWCVCKLLNTTVCVLRINWLSCLVCLRLVLMLINSLTGFTFFLLPFTFSHSVCREGNTGVILCLCRRPLMTKQCMLGLSRGRRWQERHSSLLHWGALDCVVKEGGGQRWAL